MSEIDDAMTLTEEQSEALVDLSEEIVEVLRAVAEEARDELGNAPPSDPLVALGEIENTMTGPPRARHQLARIRGEQRRYVEWRAREPFVSRFVLKWSDGTKEVRYITRGSAAAVRALDIKLASQAASPFAEFDPGDTGVLGARAFEVVERADLRPEYRDGWDALDNRFDFGEWQASVESLRQFLESTLGRPLRDDEEDLISRLRADDDLARVVHERRRRRVVERMTLRDQPTLDKHQGQVFRLPLDLRVFLIGPPGSGKTTTLIRRLAQKRHPEGLTDEEQELLAATGVRTAFERPDGWVMFAPTELLQLYLRDAFNREQVPADNARNLRTWDRERRDLAKNVLRFLNSAGETRGFELDEDGAEILRDVSSTSLSRLCDRLIEMTEATVLPRVDRAFSELSKTDDRNVARVVRRLRDRLGNPSSVTMREVSMLLDEAATLQPELLRLKKDTDDLISRGANRSLKRHPELLQELADALPMLQRGTVREDDEDDDEDDEEEEAPAPVGRNPTRQAAEILVSSLRVRARALAQGRRRTTGRSARVLELLGTRSPSDSDLSAIGAKLVVMTELRVIMSAARRLVMSIPRLYAQMRRGDDATGLLTGRGSLAIRSRKLSRLEVDVIVLAMLAMARRFFLLDRGRLVRQVPDWLESIRQRYVAQVFVDEATDFSAVQLACMLELAHPALRSWFASGDFRQRITAHGIQGPDELAWIARVAGLDGDIELKNISTGYRQSPRLAALSLALSGNAGSSSTAPDEATASEPDVQPLLVENIAGEDLARWLSGRIGEIERNVGRLPSIAIFVDGESNIDPLVELLRPMLAEQNTVVAACRDGKVIGDRQEVRVFDVQHIKGLEFEAVFFVAIEKLHQRLPELFDRFLYVGVTRAATYLGVTCEGELPQPLEHVRGHFAAGTWDT